ncbi:MAG TPA: branched-chain amino acid ABC transporter permease, partial [bacterium]|nr:branched-chain amino acid ABC transporter permease [bacterium]
VYPVFYLAFCLAVLIAVYLFLERLFWSPFGRALRSVREDETAAAAFGRNVFALKLKGYVIGGVIAGLGGALFVHFLGAFNVSAWSPVETLLLYAAIFVGGTGNNRGVILGIFLVLIFFQEVTRFLPEIPGHPDFGPAVREILIGILILAVLRWRPQGFLPEPRAKDRDPAPSAGYGAGSAVAGTQAGG